MIRLNHFSKLSGQEIFAKVEYFNPGGSVKDRIALNMIEQAEKRGDLKAGGLLVEATSGNTGLGLAMVAAVKGYQCIFVMPSKISDEKQAILKAYGAKIIITPTGVAPEDPRSYYNVAKKIVENSPNCFYVNQFFNPDNPATHYNSTGPEIWEQMEERVDAFVGGAGTGGTLSGVGKYLREKNPSINIVCADPIGSILYDLFYHGKVIDPPAAYKVEGVGEDMLPDNVQFKHMTDFFQVTDLQSFTLTREIVEKEGLCVGPSSAMALHSALEIGKKLPKSSRLVVLFPDHGRAYLSKAFNDKWLKENQLIDSRTTDQAFAKIQSMDDYYRERGWN